MSDPAPRRTPLSTPESDPRTCSPGVRLNALARVPFFARLDHEALHRVDERAEMRSMQPGEAVYLTGRRAERLYVVATGVVKLTGRSPSDGAEVLLEVAGPGAYLGTLSALGGERYAEDAWALTPGCLLAFTAGQFETVLDEHPSVARAALAAVAARLQHAHERIQRSMSSSASVRIASTLLMLAETLGVQEDDRILLDVPLAREDLAALAGCAPETVSRNLAAWRRDGIVETGRRWVALVRPDLLAEVADAETDLVVPGA